MDHDLISELQQLGIKLRLSGDSLDVIAPPGALTARLRDELRARRDELITLLRATEKGAEPTALTARPDERHEPFVLTDIQHAYWIGHNRALELGGVATHFYFELDRDGLDVARLERALRKVIARHDMLRAVIGPDGRQRVLSEVPEYGIRFYDQGDATEDAFEEHLRTLRAELDHQVLAPDTWPLFDIRATRHRDGLRLHISLDLLIMDAYSFDLLFRDWQRHYEDETWQPEPFAIGYRDFVLAEEEKRDGARYRAAEKYWLDRLDELAPAPDLPLAIQPGSADRTVFTRRRAGLPREQWELVKKNARERGLTPSSVLLAAFTDVLRLWTLQSDFTLNLTLFNRPAEVHPQLGEIIGDFTSLTLLQVSGGQDQTFARRTAGFQQQLMKDLEHLSYSGVRVLRERARRLGSGPGAGMPIVFTSALGFSGDADAMDGMAFFGEYRHGVSQTPQVWLDHQVLEENGELVFNWDAVEALFPEGLLDDMFATFQALLDRLSSEPGLWDALGPTVSAPRPQLEQRDGVNATGLDLPGGTLLGIVAEQALRTPDATAVLSDSGRLGYGEVMASAYRLAHRLAGLGARPGTLVGVVLDKSPEQVPAVLGVVASGAAYLPVDPQWPAARRRQLMESGRVGVVVTSSRYRDELDWPDGTVLVALDDAETLAQPDSAPDTAPAPEDLAYVIFTSGSTGVPKGVMIDHRGAVNTIQDLNRRFSVGPTDRVLGLSALTFDLSVYDVFGTLAAGGTLVLPSAERSYDPVCWAELVERHGITVWNSVPALMQLWADSSARPSEERAGDLRLVLLSGDWIPVALPDAVRARHPRAEVISLGGATEASIWSVHHPIGEVPPEWTRIPYGKPLANQTLHVLDDRFEARPVWATGEIWIGGTGVAKGYWADRERTAERFVPHPETGELLYRTGDLGRYLPDGDIEFLGRRDFQVKINGYRVELGEIAATLERLPGVSRAIARVDTNPATGRRQLVAYAVPAGTGAPESAELLAELAGLLPDYMVPKHCLFIDAIPLSANGKVDAAGLPVPWSELDAYEIVAPRDETEAAVAAIWAQAMEFDGFGVEDNFFEIGGDSLHAVQILTRVREEFHWEGDTEEGLQLLFENPTVAGLAALLKARQEA
ncbi:non-ribosomal peptide synthetase [Streptomyces sp. JV184]|uniref:non-ribosomal peptide synthetase n=1 Tax=Streptomyces sp. JV184 TaxID=858637 RepID=UPI002E76E0E0|nr:amino acid adenylation domain-containing protein [Streptomyces sp. JV184]MEE1748376.1 amino acid adenylation domain-containing protein [Streptomyces sp. JV184]